MMPAPVRSYLSNMMNTLSTAIFLFFKNIVTETLSAADFWANARGISQVKKRKSNKIVFIQDRGSVCVDLHRVIYKTPKLGVEVHKM
jgi:hypothetical protein